MPGFHDEYVDEGGSAYLVEDEKREMAERGTAFIVSSIEVRPNPFEDGEQVVLTIVLEDDEEQAERLLTFTVGAVESRDRMLLGTDTQQGMLQYLEDPANDPPVEKLELVGRSYLLRDARDSARSAAKPATARGPRAAAKRSTKPAAKKPVAKTTAKRPAAKPAKRAAAKRSTRR